MVLHIKVKNILQTYENSVQTRAFILKRGKSNVSVEKLYSVELHDLYTSPYIISMMKTRRMRCKENVACIRQKQGAQFPLGNLKGRNHFEDVRIDGRATAKQVLKT